MGFYPMIDYVGGLKGVGDNLNGIFEDIRANKRQQILEDEQRSQAEYRALLGQKMKEEIADKQRSREAMAGFPAFLEANRGKLDYGTETRNVPDPATANEFYPGGTTKTFTTPPKETYGSLAGKYFMEKDPEKGLKFLADESKRKDDKAKQQADFANKFMAKAIDAGDNDAANKMLEAWKQSDNPYLKNMAGGIDNIKVVGKDKLEVTVKKMMQADELFKGSPAGEYDVVYESSTANPTPKIKSAKPAKAEDVKDRFEPAGYGQMYDKKEQKMVKVPVNPAGDDMTELNKMLKQNQLEKDEQAKKDKVVEGVNKANDYAKDELNDKKNYDNGRVRGGKLKPTAEATIRERLNSAGKDLQVTVIPAEKNWRGVPDGPDKYEYSIIRKKQEAPAQPDTKPAVKPISPQLNKGGAKTSRLSNVPDAVLEKVLAMRGASRGLGGIA